ncbi:MAG: NAD(P)-binding protein [Clostridiales bacterium]|nr:NAD(P)-binding protein [Clostridiales bacterium]
MKIFRLITAAALVGAAAYVANKSVKQTKEAYRRAAEDEIKSRDWGNKQIYIIGGGIASLAAAAYLVRDCNFKGENIHIIESGDKVGGEFACVGSAESGFISRGAVLWPDSSENFFELMKSVPSVEAPQRSAAEEIYNFRQGHPVNAKARLVSGGVIADLSSLELDADDRTALLKLLFADEKSLSDLRIDQWFGEHFFTTDFWYLWESTFRIRRWDSLAEFRRQIKRYVDFLPDLASMSSRMETPYDFGESVIEPLKAYLEKYDVDFITGAKAVNLEFAPVEECCCDICCPESEECAEDDCCPEGCCCEECRTEGEECAEDEGCAEGCCCEECCTDGEECAEDEGCPDGCCCEECCTEGEECAEDEGCPDGCCCDECCTEGEECAEDEGCPDGCCCEECCTEDEDCTKDKCCDDGCCCDECCTDEELKDKADKAAEKISEAADAVFGAASELAEKAGEAAEKAVDAAKKIAAKAAETAGNVADRIREEVISDKTDKKETEECCRKAAASITVTAIILEDGRIIALNPDDLCIMTAAHDTGAAMYGTSDTPAFKETEHAPSLWEKIAEGRPALGEPQRFFSDIKGSAVETFTVTSRGNKLVKLFENLSGNIPGSGGMTTIKDCEWLLSATVPAQPRFKEQDIGTTVIYGYGLYPENIGTYVRKPMKDCTGLEILYELVCQLQWADRWEEIKADVISVVPVYLPYAEAALLPRGEKTRPAPVPEGSTNLALIGRYTELPLDTTSQIEYSVRSARTAVYRIMNYRRGVEPVKQKLLKPDALAKALQAIFK